MDLVDNLYKIPGKGKELSDNVTKLVNDLRKDGYEIGVNCFAPEGQIAIRPHGETSKTTEVGHIDITNRFVNVYDKKSNLYNFLSKYKF